MPSEKRVEVKIPGFLNDYLAVRVPRSAALFVMCIAWIAGSLVTIMSPVSAWIFLPLFGILAYFLYPLVKKAPKPKPPELEKETKFSRPED